ncbi:MAG: DUF2203 domain-containing protein [Planctomycetes bacterium]|nr:DUF2203 domain-containing protein [Planctomycetota bacterium]
MKIFTPQEASRTLPLVRRIVADVLERGRELQALERAPDLTVEQQDRVGVLEGELDELCEELARLGCSFRSPDFTFGLVDFPGLIDGRLVHLCWRDDEPELRWYHEPHAGFAGRRPIPEHLLAPPAATSS